jgi:hypothetical protein
MSNYRVNNVLQLNNGQSGSLANAWGIMVASGSTGTLTLQPATLGGSTFTTMSISHIAVGHPFPCYPRTVTVTTGTVYLLA